MRPNYKLRSTSDLLRRMADVNLNIVGATFALQHVCDVASRAVAEELAEGFFVVGNPMFLDQGDEVSGRVARQGRLGKMRVAGNKILRAAMNVGEVTAPPAGNKNFLPDPVGGFKDDDSPPAFAGFDRTHEPGSAGAEYDDIAFLR